MIQLTQPLEFHWTMSSAGDNLRGARSRKEVSGIPDMQAHIDFCKHSERCSIDSLLTAFGFHRADPITLATALGIQTNSIKFLIACRSGVNSPTHFVQQINSLSQVIGDRIYINMVAGHSPEEFKYYGDQVAPLKRYDRTDEFLTICHQFWDESDVVNFEGTYYHVTNGRLNTPYFNRERGRPKIFLGGSSGRALELAAKHADCLLTLPKSPDQLKSKIAGILDLGKEVGLMVSLICRPSKEEAHQAAATLIENLDETSKKVHTSFVKNSVSDVFNSTIESALRGDQWLTDTLWQGAVPFLGAPSIALVGSYENIAHSLLAYKQIGISQFLLKGWPDLEEMTHFHLGVLPVLRKLERTKPQLMTEKLIR